MRNFLESLLLKIKRPKLEGEAFDAYYNRLPDSINVHWVRDGDMIVGEIIADDNKFMTQGKDANDFIEMVNDAVYTVYDIPEDFLEIIKKTRSFMPKPDALAKLKISNSGNILVSKEKPA